MSVVTFLHWLVDSLAFNEDSFSPAETLQRWATGYGSKNYVEGYDFIMVTYIYVTIGFAIILTAKKGRKRFHNTGLNLLAYVIQGPSFNISSNPKLDKHALPEETVTNLTGSWLRTWPT